MTTTMTLGENLQIRYRNNESDDRVERLGMTAENW